MPVAATTRFTNAKLTPASPNGIKTGTLRLPGGINWAAGQVLGVLTGSAASAVVRLTFGGTPSGGTFQLIFGNDITASITWSGTAATLVANVQAAMDALFGTGTTVVSGTGPYDITFQNEYASRSIALPTATNAMTGTSPTITPSLQAAGHPGSGLAAAYLDANSDGSNVARQLLMYATRTDSLGNVITDRPGNYNSCETYTGGDFFCADLTGLDANGVADLGRLINAPTIATSGAVLHVNG